MSKKKECEIVIIDNLTTIKYKNIVFETEKHFKCKCGSELLFKRKTNKKLGNYLEIISCSDKNCKTNQKLKRKEYWEMFFPIQVYEKQIKKIRDNLKDNHITNINMWLRKGLSEEEAIKKISQIQRESSLKNVENRFIPTKENYRKLGYSEEEIFNFSLTPAMVNFWIKKGYSEKDAIKQVSLNQSYAAKHVDFDKRLLPMNVEYWLEKGFTTDESILKVKERQKTFSKEICIKKYGFEKGMKILNERNKKWLKSLHQNGNMSSGYSKISQELFEKLDTKENNYYFATKNYEISFKYQNSLLYLYDFCDEDNKKIIEYHGDIFHANPKHFKYNEEYHPFNNEKSFEKWEKDEKKMNVAKQLGYEILIIWDSEYRENKEQVINKCKQFLKTKEER